MAARAGSCIVGGTGAAGRTPACDGIGDGGDARPGLHGVVGNCRTAEQTVRLFRISGGAEQRARAWIGLLGIDGFDGGAAW